MACNQSYRDVLGENSNCNNEKREREGKELLSGRIMVKRTIELPVFIQLWQSQSHLLLEELFSLLEWVIPHHFHKVKSTNGLLRIKFMCGHGGAWWEAVYGVAQSQTRLKRLSSSRNSEDNIKNFRINTKQGNLGYFLWKSRHRNYLGTHCQDQSTMVEHWLLWLFPLHKTQIWTRFSSNVGRFCYCLYDMV